jgi:hydroxyacylglutathione hydrolase
MREIAKGVHQLPLFPRDAVNAYVIGDVLVDAGMKGSAKKILKMLEASGTTITTHVITHAHVDHAGGTSRVTASLPGAVRVLTGVGDEQAVETGEPELTSAMSRRGLKGLSGFVGGFDGTPVDGTLSEGDEIGPGFVVLDTPGHTRGHISLWRESDGVLLCGDVVNAMNLLTTRPGLHEPPTAFSPDPALNRTSARRLASLQPRVLGAGHGPVMVDAAGPLRAFAATLATD